ncbi:MAG TPA: DUF1080 domain-containing protein [Bryobacterales bacterium]|nr:DUF1080 domain-containing protein [Bryobacterales bacterium]
MRSSRFLLALAATLLAATLLAAVSLRAAEPPLNQLGNGEKQQGYKLLFDGKSLNGWDGAPNLWRVEDAAIVGSTDGHGIEHNSFLILDRHYGNFVLRLQIKLRNGNSGIQFRGSRLPDWVVKGYQADASEAGERSAWGNLYEEKGRGRGVMATPSEGWDRAKSIVHQGQWNDYEIYANGDHIRLTLNGAVTIDARDAESSSGVIAIQLHTGAPMEVRLRNIRIRELP